MKKTKKQTDYYKLGFILKKYCLKLKSRKIKKLKPEPNQNRITCAG